MNSQRKSGAFLAYFNIILKNLVIFLYTPFLLRYLGQSEYGLYQMTNSVITSLSLLSMGFSGAYIRFYTRSRIAKDEEGIKQLNGMYLLLFMGMGVIAIILGGILVTNTELIFENSFTPDQLRTTKLLMSIMVLNIALTFPSSVFDSNIMVHEQFLFQQTRQIMQTILLPVLTIPLVMLGFQSVSIVVVQTFITIVFLLLNMQYAIRKLGMRFKFRNLPFHMLAEVATFSFFIFLNQIVDLVNNNVPSFIVGIYSGPEDVATYAVAMQIKSLFFMLSVTLSNVFIPYVNNLVSKGATSETLTNLMIRVGRIQLIVLTFIFGGFVTVGKYFINVWAGNENELAYYLIILMVLPVLVPLSQNVGIEIQKAMNKHYFRSVVYISFAIANIVITVIGVQLFGLVGSIMGYVFSIVFANGVMMNWYYSKKMFLNVGLFWRGISKIIISCVLLIIFFQFVQIIYPITSLIDFLVYGILYVAFYVFIFFKIIGNKQEINSILGFIKK